MWAQLTPWLKEQGRRLVLTLTPHIRARSGRRSCGLWQAVRPTLVFVLNVLAALLLLFEEWGWRPLSTLVARLARFPLWAVVERWIAGLPPYGALVTLAVPSAILIPAKLLGVYLLATGHFVTAVAVIICAKLASTALIARIFLLTKPALMQIAWFAQRLRGVRALAGGAVCAHPQLVGLALRARLATGAPSNYTRRTWADLRPQLEAAWVDFKPRALAWTRGSGLRHASERALRRAALRRLQARRACRGPCASGRALLRRLQGPELQLERLGSRDVERHFLDRGRALVVEPGERRACRGPAPSGRTRCRGWRRCRSRASAENTSLALEASP